MDDDFIKKRLARDMAELKKLCEEHFKQRAIDEEKVKELEDRISAFKKVFYFLFICVFFVFILFVFILFIYLFRKEKLTKKIALKRNKKRMLVWKSSSKRLWQRKLKDKLKLKPERQKFLLVSHFYPILNPPDHFDVLWNQHQATMKKFRDVQQEREATFF